MGKPPIYVVGRLVDEHSPHWADLLKVVRTTFPDAEILDGVDLAAIRERDRTKL